MTNVTKENLQSFPTRIGKIIQTQKIPSQSGARDIGGAVVTPTGRIVIAAGTSDGELNHPYKIIVTDDGGKTIREVFSLPAEEMRTYHTLGLAYDYKHHIIVSMLGRNDGYRLLDRPYGKMLPFSMDYCGDNQIIIARSWDDGETWTTQTQPLKKPENSSGIIGAAVQVGDDLFFPHNTGTCNPEGTQWVTVAPLARLRNIPKGDGTFSCEYEHEFRTLSVPRDGEMNEVVYLDKVDRSGYLSFHREHQGPPLRREYNLDHRPTCDFERCRVIGFDPRDYDPGHNGPLLVAFGIIRMADGNLLCGSRFYGTQHHRAGNIFMTSRDEGKTWFFADDYIPWTIAPLQFPNSGWGGNPQMDYGPDGTLIHITSEQLMGVRINPDGYVDMNPPPAGGFSLCRFEGLTVTGNTPDNRGEGTLTIDVSTITRIDEVYLNKISIEQSNNCQFRKEDEDLYYFSADGRRVSFAYKITGPSASVRVKIVVANRKNPHRPVFLTKILFSDRE